MIRDIIPQPYARAFSRGGLIVGGSGLADTRRSLSQPFNNNLLEEPR